MPLRERTRPGLGIIEPCLPSPAKVPPSGPGWLHEIKHDGFRILARRERGNKIPGSQSEFENHLFGVCHEDFSVHPWCVCGRRLP
jgi:hypothetical protein